MKSPFVAAVCLIAFAFTGVAYAGAGPVSPLYLSWTAAGGIKDIAVVQGSTVINTFPEVYDIPYEIPIAVYGDVRTAGYTYPQNPGGGQYTLGGTPTGTTYNLPSVITIAYDSTSDGAHNYLVDLNTGFVYQTARDYSNQVALFNVGGREAGITYDAVNKSLWISGWNNSTVADYSLNGTLLSSFSTGHTNNGALAFDPADHTLWLVNDATSGDLEQYSTAGTLLSVGPNVGFTLGGEFNLGATPEPGSLVMFGSGVLGLAGLLRRKINL